MSESLGHYIVYVMTQMQQLLDYVWFVIIINKYKSIVL